MNKRLRILRTNAVNSWQISTAYFGDSWGNVLSTIFYTVTLLIFLSVIFANVKTMAGYSRNQMLFLLLVNQINFYLIYAWSYNNVTKMVEDVNRGAFDMLLVKPIPALFYTSTRTIGTMSLLRDGLPSVTIFSLAIGWSALHLSLGNLAAAFVVLIAGQLALNAFFMFLGLPVFWLGQSASLLDLGYSISSLDIPYEGVTTGLRTFLTVAVPCLLPTALAASVALGKAPTGPSIALAISVALGLTLIKQFLWRKALENYTSASS